jgi:hypothetical protein
MGLTTLVLLNGPAGLRSFVVDCWVPIPEDQDLEDLTFAATVRKAKAVLPIAETSSLSWLALEQR